MDFTIKNFRSLSSGAYTATLYQDGKRVATVEDDGRGGQVRINPVKAENWGSVRASLEAVLTNWAEVSLPEWYLTSYGTHPALNARSFELAIDYLIECAENDEIIKKGRTLFLRPDNKQVTAAGGATTDALARGYKVWRHGDWRTS